MRDRPSGAARRQIPEGFPPAGRAQGAGNRTATGPCGAPRQAACRAGNRCCHSCPPAPGRAGRSASVRSSGPSVSPAGRSLCRGEGGDRVGRGRRQLLHRDAGRDAQQQRHSQPPVALQPADHAAGGPASGSPAPRWTPGVRAAGAAPRERPPILRTDEGRRAPRSKTREELRGRAVAGGCRPEAAGWRDGTRKGGHGATLRIGRNAGQAQSGLCGERPQIPRPGDGTAAGPQPCGTVPSLRKPRRAPESPPGPEQGPGRPCCPWRRGSRSGRSRNP